MCDGLFTEVYDGNDEANENIVSCHLVILVQAFTIFILSTVITIACDCIY